MNVIVAGRLRRQRGARSRGESAALEEEDVVVYQDEPPA
jgi:hypothetical protein